MIDGNNCIFAFLRQMGIYAGRAPSSTYTYTCNIIMQKTINKISSARSNSHDLSDEKLIPKFEIIEIAFMK